jgi:prenylcysteine oxidase / farnesylcysteine lyase
MLWALVLFPQLAVAFSWASLFGGHGVAADQYIIQATVPREPRIAIVGAGAAGSSAAFWITKAAERLGKEIVVDVFERADYIGGSAFYPLRHDCASHHIVTGSTVVYPYNDTSLKPAELGASIFIDANKNLIRAAQEFNLDVISFEDGDEQLGVWDGSNILVTVRILVHAF